MYPGHGPAKQVSCKVPNPSLALPAKANELGSDYRGQTRLWLRLLACTTLISGKLRRKFREHFEFTLPRFELLAQLDREVGGLAQGELSKRLMVSAGNITPILNRLVDEGLIERIPSHLDRRVQIVRLTVEGRKKFRQMAKKHSQWLSEIFDGLDRGELESLDRQLSRLKQLLKDSDSGNEIDLIE